MLVAGVLGAVAVVGGWVWLGLFLMYMNEVLDCVDGEIARYRKIFSLRGLYLDMVNHLVTQALFFLALTVWVASSVEDPFRTVVLVGGVLGALSMPLRRANGSLHREIFVHHYVPNPARYPLPPVTPKVHTEASHAPTTLSPIKLIKSAIYYSEYLVIMIVEVAGAYAAELVFFPHAAGHPVLAWVLLAYAAVSCLYLVREVFGTFFDMEHRIARVRQQLHDKQNELFRD
jgi:phosphatidylglycerophosphate synthase